MIIAKQRNGPTGTIDLTFLERWTKFGNASMMDEPSGALEQTGTQETPF
jgi:hypothetical protein